MVRAEKLEGRKRSRDEVKESVSSGNSSTVLAKWTPSNVTPAATPDLLQPNTAVLIPSDMPIYFDLRGLPQMFPTMCYPRPPGNYFGRLPAFPTMPLLPRNVILPVMHNSTTTPSTETTATTATSVRATSASSDEQSQVDVHRSAAVNPPAKKGKKSTRPRLRNFLCTYPGCAKAFTDNAHLRDHAFVHSGEKSLACPVCGKAFARMSSLKSHRRVHTGEKPFVCPTEGCDKRYSSRGALKMHVTTHAATRDHECADCAKCFRLPEQLKAHQRKHTSEKAFTCSSCDRSFSTKPCLRSHYTRVHLGEFPDACSRTRCQRLAARIKQQRHTIAQLRKQMTRLKEEQLPPEKLDKIKAARDRKRESEPIVAPLHFLTGEKPFSCMHAGCMKKFANFFQLKFHAKQHPGVPDKDIVGGQVPLPVGPKFCPVEGCEFSKKYNKPMKTLQITKRHWQRAHQTERPFGCPSCNRRFNPENMTAHQKDCEVK